MSLLPPTWFLIGLVLMFMFHFTIPIQRIIPYPWSHLGSILIGFGAIITIWADRIFKRYKTAIKPADKPSTLVVEGPFRVSRNPMYLGMIMILFGIAIWLGSLSAFIGPLGLILVFAICYIPVEERNMASAFEEDYEAYRAKVRRWM